MSSSMPRLYQGQVGYARGAPSFYKKALFEHGARAKFVPCRITFAARFFKTTNMKNTVLLLLFATAFAACGHRHNAAPIPPGTPVVYACPMDCEKGKTYPQPGTCPVCKMDLEAVADTSATSAPTDTVALTPSKTLEAETMRIHDEAMMEMAEMNRVRREMKDFMTKAKMTAEGLKTWRQTLTDIEKAEEGMMSWMAGYKDPVGQSEADALKYLQEQRDKIAQNQADIRAATAAGKKLLGK